MLSTRHTALDKFTRCIRLDTLRRQSLLPLAEFANSIGFGVGRGLRASAVVEQLGVLVQEDNVVVLVYGSSMAV